MMPVISSMKSSMICLCVESLTNVFPWVNKTRFYAQMITHVPSVHIDIAVN